MSVFVQPAPATQCSQLLPASAVSAPNSCPQLLSAPTNSCQPTTTELLQGQAQTHLCARLSRADGGAAAVALHPADDGIAHPVAVWVYGF